jgi:mannose-1-phosphate guanylyltransferase
MRSGAGPWTLILAGGDGVRLRGLTRRISGDTRPKQYCALDHDETLLERTRRRAALVGGDEREVVVVSRAHEAYYRYLFREMSEERVVVQPENRGTAPGILYPLLRIARLAGDPPVVVLPSDHPRRRRRRARGAPACRHRGRDTSVGNARAPGPARAVTGD